jgi:hypothetical protein
MDLSSEQPHHGPRFRVGAIIPFSEPPAIVPA